jgi:uncharacterized protein (DUF924 family)
MAITSPDEVLSFWLGEDGAAPLANAKRWFAKDAAFDEEVRARFGEAIDAAVRGELASWRETPRGRLALVVLLDQLSRNAFRDTPRSFAQDPLALEIAEESMAAGDAAALSPIQRAFLAMPLMHAEDRARQRRCVEIFTELHAGASGELAGYFENALDFAKRHAAIVERFGRFPHRNAILSRESTPEEREFLAKPGSSF